MTKNKPASVTAAPAANTASSPAVFASLPTPLRLPLQLAHGVLFRHDYFPCLLALVLIAELVLGVLIIRKVAYTEIDWIAYMQEVSGFLHGELDYMNLKGDTGPLVYPAGFVYLYSALYYLTDLGTNILRAQYIFLAIYLAFIAVLMMIYHEAKICPPWVMLLLCASRRIHSIFMLRCFNDCVAMLLLYAAVLLLLRRRWTLACVGVSLALSVKMNILLFMPALGILLLQRFGVWRTLPRLLLMLLIQVALGLPFLLHAPWSYLSRAFDFGRAFFYVWTVNLKILPEEIFLSKQLATGLLVTHLIVLFVFINKMVSGGLAVFIRDIFRSLFSPLTGGSGSRCSEPSAGYSVTLLFASNLVGVVFARSLHYQFYVWYYHSLPLLLYLTPLPNIARLVILALIEYSWNVFPATPLSSTILIACHLTLIGALLASSRLPAPPSTTLAPPAKKVQ